jgi:hypothetical protein
VHSSIEHRTDHNTVTHYQTVKKAGYEPKTVSMPPLKKWTRRPKSRDHTTKVHPHTKAARDVVEYVHATVVETIQPTAIAYQGETRIHTERIQSTVHVKHTKSVKDHHHPTVTGLVNLHTVRHPKHNKPAATAVAKIGWFA